MSSILFDYLGSKEDMWRISIAKKILQERNYPTTELNKLLLLWNSPPNILSLFMRKYNFLIAPMRSKQKCLHILNKT